MKFEKRAAQHGRIFKAENLRNVLKNIKKNFQFKFEKRAAIGIGITAAAGTIEKRPINTPVGARIAGPGSTGSEPKGRSPRRKLRLS